MQKQFRAVANWAEKYGALNSNLNLDPVLGHWTHRRASPICAQLWLSVCLLSCASSPILFDVFRSRNWELPRCFFLMNGIHCISLPSISWQIDQIFKQRVAACDKSAIKSSADSNPVENRTKKPGCNCAGQLERMLAML